MSEKRIVVLDGHTLNPGDLSWQPLEELGRLEVHPRSGADRVIGRARRAEIVLTNKEVLNREVIAQLPELRYIGVLATGTNVVDLEAAREQGVVVTNVPGYGASAVAQHVFALLLAASNRVAEHDQAVRRGEWSRCPDFCFTVAPILELGGLTFGVVGFGAIGQAVARIARAFGMRVVVAQRPSARGSRVMGPEGLESVELVPLDQLFREADVVSLHCPLTPETTHLVDRKRLDSMKSDALLINTGRGPLVDEQALGDTLRRGHLRGAVLDVLSHEPPPAENPLIGAPRCLITPHIAWASGAARGRLLETAVANLRGFLSGQPRNVVS